MACYRLAQRERMKEGKGKEIAYAFHSIVLPSISRILLSVVERTRKNKL